MRVAFYLLTKPFLANRLDVFYVLCALNHAHNAFGIITVSLVRMLLCRADIHLQELQSESDWVSSWVFGFFFCIEEAIGVLFSCDKSRKRLLQAAFKTTEEDKSHCKL